jgi:hypothetical protein
VTDRDDRARRAPLLPQAPLRFAPGFAWGVASSAFPFRILKGLEPRPRVATIEVYLDPHPTDPAEAGTRAAAERFDVDNTEWRFGLSPETRFGLVGFDPDRGDRHVKASGCWLAEVIRAGVLDPARIP